MKKTTLFIILLSLFVPFFTCCGALSEDIKDTDKIRITCTSFAAFDWTRQITKGSEAVEVRLLTEGGVDIHNYVPSVADAARISSSDMIIYIGSQAESFIEESAGEGAELINLLSLLGENALEIPKSVTDDHDHDHHAHGEYDEHVWLSLKNARFFCEVICQRISAADEENAGLYKNNCETYVNELLDLENAFYEAAEEGRVRLMMFADRFPFTYLFHDCGVDFYAAFEGCSSESEATFETVAVLSELLKNSELGFVIITEGSDARLANTVIGTSGKSGVQVITMNSIQQVSKDRIAKGVTYIDIMKENLVAFKKALS